jgi:hypothetical protein
MCLSTSGHILGIVNPVVNPPKRDFHVGAASGTIRRTSGCERAEFRHGSWWEDWMAWLKPQSGQALVAAPPVATKGFRRWPMHPEPMCSSLELRCSKTPAQYRVYRTPVARFLLG